MWSMRWPDGELAAARAHADALGVPLATLVRDLVRAEVEAGHGEPSMAVNPALIGESHVTPAAARRPARTAGAAVMAAASVVAPAVRTSPRLTGSDPRAGCTHPPASVRTRGGIRSCGNCGTVLAAKP